MKRLSVLIWMLLSPFALAQTVDVNSGDHAGFTRLVLELPKAADWKLGRTKEGYALKIQDEALQFNVAGVFNDIQRNRLAAIWTDPVSGALQLGVACACHAIPFEFRPGIIVVDLRDGPPPKGSSFELALDGSNASNLTQKPRIRPRARPSITVEMQNTVMQGEQRYDWLGTVRPKLDHETRPEPTRALPLIVQYTDLRPLKEGLLQQLSQGAAQGLVQMQQPKLSPDRMSEPRPPLGPRTNIRLGDVPGFAATTRRISEQTLIKDGASCISSETLDVSSWANDQSVTGQLAESRENLIGEFDRPNSENVIRAVKLLINLGFGAEAQQMLTKMPVDHDDLPVWKSLAKLVDGDSDSNGPFADMQICDSAAALWAVLAIPEVPKDQKQNTDAVLRGFSALPAHLRRNLGPRLAAKFLAMGDIATSQSLSNSVLRGAAEKGATLAVMSATLNIAAGDPSAASLDLQPELADAGPASADVLIALVDAKIAADEAIGPDVAVALAAFVHEQKGGPLEPALQRAQILALGSSGDFDQAFAFLPNAPMAEGDLWKLLAKSKSDTSIITHAVFPAATMIPTLAKSYSSDIASRLLDLGLPDAAMVWIGPLTADIAMSDRLLAARANLSRGDPSTSLMWLAGLGESSAAELRAQSYAALGQAANAAVAWREAGNSEAELRSQSWAQNWSALAAIDASPWQAAATILAGGKSKDVAGLSGPLAVGNALVAESATVRAALSDLLATVSGPPPKE